MRGTGTPRVENQRDRYSEEPERQALGKETQRDESIRE